MVGEPADIIADIEVARRLERKERFRRLGEYLRADSLAASDDDTDDEECGKRFFDRASAEFQDQVCKSPSKKFIWIINRLPIF